MEEKLFTEKEVEEIKKQEYQNKIMQFARQIESMISTNMVASQKKQLFSKKFNAENVKMYLENPAKYEQQLRELSTTLITISPQYSQICSYLSSICKFLPVITPNINKFTNLDKLKNEYLKCCDYVDNMKISHEFQKIMEVITREDIYYGYCIDNGKDDFYIMQLDSDYCKISSVTQGCFNLIFDMSYFDKTKNMKNVTDNGEASDLINFYPDEFKILYAKYKKDARLRWAELSDDSTIVIKFSEMLPFIFPRYANLFDDIYDLSVYKQLGKAKTESDNYKFIAMEMESNKDGKTDSFTTSIETVMQFYNMLNMNLPEGVSAFISPVGVKDISFSNTTASDKSAIDTALNNTYISSGISAVNFGKGTTNAGTVKMSNIIDESLLFKIYRQFERWLSRRIGRIYKNKFSIKLLDVTTLSIGDEIDRQLKLAQYGIPNKLVLCTLAGISQNQERGMSAIEEALGLHDGSTWIPLSSSHTMSSSESTEESGRPSVADEDVESENTVASKNNDSNGNKV